jgi:AcrR family transcriptional regulator
MKSPRINIAGIRREQIVEAAAAIITEQGIQNLSLSEIEKRAGMSRGQLTYYFRTKEDILLAVFDRLVSLMHERVGEPVCPAGQQAGTWEWIEHLLRKLLLTPPMHPQFGCLQYTFLSQIAHRDDFRQKLAGLYRYWRQEMGQGLAEAFPTRLQGKPVPPQAFASLVQALMHGLAMQKTADPDAFDGAEMLALCLDVLGSYLGKDAVQCDHHRSAAKPAPAGTARTKELANPPPAGVAESDHAHGPRSSSGS